MIGIDFILGTDLLGEETLLDGIGSLLGRQSGLQMVGNALTERPSLERLMTKVYGGYGGNRVFGLRHSLLLLQSLLYHNQSLDLLC